MKILGLIDIKRNNVPNSELLRNMTHLTLIAKLNYMGLLMRSYLTVALEFLLIILRDCPSDISSARRKNEVAFFAICCLPSL